MMKTSRRNFLQKTAKAGGAIALAGLFTPAYTRNLQEAVERMGHLPPDELAGEEDFWQWVKNAFTASPNIINMNNGGVCPQPKSVQEVFEHYYHVANEGPAYYMWQIVDSGRENVRRELAALADVDPETIAIQRNTSEALETVIFGIDLRKGDEVVLTKQDYPNMINAWKQRALREGIVLKWVDLPMPIEDDDKIVALYEEQFTSRTRVVQIMHMINWTGQILPARKIADAAHERGIEVMVDGAHTFAHFQFSIRELECDYFGTSLHKWLYAPFGTGMLYVRKDKIAKLWPHMAPSDPTSDDIRKFEALGTRDNPAEMAVGKALEFHNLLGPARKEARLRYLKDYWMKGISDIPGVRYYTSFKPEYACGLGNFAIEGIEPGTIQKKLFSKYKIYTIAINWENIHGIRVTPNVYTSMDEMDYLIRALHEIAG